MGQAQATCCTAPAHRRLVCSGCHSLRSGGGHAAPSVSVKDGGRRKDEFSVKLARIWPRGWRVQFSMCSAKYGCNGGRVNSCAHTPAVNPLLTCRWCIASTLLSSAGSSTSVEQSQKRRGLGVQLVSEGLLYIRHHWCRRWIQVTVSSEQACRAGTVGRGCPCHPAHVVSSCAPAVTSEPSGWLLNQNLCASECW